jgi:phosphoglycolate phosphatase
MTDVAADIQVACPVCGGEEFVDFRKSPKIQCADCGSLSRHRAAWMFLRDYVRPQPDWRVLHLAPDLSLARLFMSVCNDGYDPADISPEGFARKIGRPVRRLDLVTDAATLPSEHYDLVVHSHVIEHIPANATLVLQHLQRAIKPGGVHLFAFPLRPGYSKENLDTTMPPEDRKRDFGHIHHYRRFGMDDFDINIGPVIGVSSSYSLEDFFPAETLLAANIPRKVWRGTGSTVFMVRKPK